MYADFKYNCIYFLTKTNKIILDKLLRMFFLGESILSLSTDVNMTIDVYIRKTS